MSVLIKRKKLKVVAALKKSKKQPVDVALKKPRVQKPQVARAIHANALKKPQVNAVAPIASAANNFILSFGKIFL